MSGSERCSDTPLSRSRHLNEELGLDPSGIDGQLRSRYVSLTPGCVVHAPRVATAPRRPRRAWTARQTPGAAARATRGHGPAAAASPARPPRSPSRASPRLARNVRRRSRRRHPRGPIPNGFRLLQATTIGSTAGPDDRREGAPRSDAGPRAAGRGTGRRPGRCRRGRRAPRHGDAAQAASSPERKVACDARLPSARARARSTARAATSIPATRWPRAASSTAWRPVPHPASRMAPANAPSSQQPAGPRAGDDRSPRTACPRRRRRRLGRHSASPSAQRRPCGSARGPVRRGDPTPTRPAVTPRTRNPRQIS